MLILKSILVMLATFSAVLYLYTLYRVANEERKHVAFTRAKLALFNYCVWFLVLMSSTVRKGNIIGPYCFIRPLCFSWTWIFVFDPFLKSNKEKSGSGFLNLFQKYKLIIVRCVLTVFDVYYLTDKRLLSFIATKEKTLIVSADALYEAYTWLSIPMIIVVLALPLLQLKQDQSKSVATRVL